MYLLLINIYYLINVYLLFGSDMYIFKSNLGFFS